MTTIKNRVENLFDNGRSYTAKSLSTVLKIKYETGRKYVRQLLHEAKLSRLPAVDKNSGRKVYRYFA